MRSPHPAPSPSLDLVSRESGVVFEIRSREHLALLLAQLDTLAHVLSDRLFFLGRSPLFYA